MFKIEKKDEDFPHFDVRILAIWALFSDSAQLDSKI